MKSCWGLWLRCLLVLRWSKIKSKRTLFAIGAIFALTGLVHLFEPLDIAATSTANKMRLQTASGEFVVVAMDDFLQGENAAWPWAQEDIANAIELVLDAGASRVVLSHEVPLTGSKVDDRLQHLIESNPKSLYIVEPVDREGAWKKGRSIAGKSFVSSDTAVHAYQLVRFWGGVEYDYLALESDGRTLSSVAAILTGRQGGLDEYYPIDFAIEAATIPYMSLGAMYAIEQSRSVVSGKTVILGFEAPPNSKPIKFLGQGQFGAATLIAMQAETLQQGRPIELSWYVPWFVSFLLCVLVAQMKRARYQALVLVAVLVASFSFMVLINSIGVRFGIANGWVMVTVAAVVGISRNLREKTRLENAVHPISGLPSTDALRTLEQSDLALVHMKIRRSSELLDILENPQQKVLAQKVADLVSPSGDIWHGDNGRFYWFANDYSLETAEQHFQSLALIFRNGFCIDELNVSLDVVFGVDERAQASMTDRVHGATISAKQAIIKGALWHAYEAVDRTEATWSVTMLKELDLAIEQGHIYAVLQPKLDLRTGQISGAEALARWYHPTKGLIRPDEFIDQADQGGRLLELTLCVFEHALPTSAQTIAEDPDFVLSLNISPSLLELPSFPLELANKVEGFGVDPRNIMLEITESSQFANDDVCANTMRRLREFGFHLSIDDYGTANSTLEYLRKIPASELKIDRKFVQNMLESEADYHLVASTIQLAHRLGMRVVAEGVEEIDTLNTLKSLNCDLVQGYLFSKPLKSNDFLGFMHQHEANEKGGKAVNAS